MTIMHPNIAWWPSFLFENHSLVHTFYTNWAGFWGLLTYQTPLYFYAFSYSICPLILKGFLSFYAMVF